jgi:hypothetical protein
VVNGGIWPDSFEQTAANQPKHANKTHHQHPPAINSHNQPLMALSTTPFGSFWAAQLGYPPRQWPENSQASLWIPVEDSQNWPFSCSIYLTIPKMDVNHLKTYLWWQIC